MKIVITVAVLRLTNREMVDAVLDVVAEPDLVTPVAHRSVVTDTKPELNSEFWIWC